MTRENVKRAFKYRFSPTDAQAVELSRTFGCVRLVYNRALAERTAAWHTEQRRLSYADTSAALTAWKKTEELSFLNEVSCVPLLCEDTIEQVPATNDAVGIDAGITSVVTLSTGEKVANPRHEQRDRARLARAQRALARKTKGSANRDRARRKVARCTPASPTAGATFCTSSPLDSSVRTKWS